MLVSDGLFVGGDYALSIYSTGDLHERNDTYQVAEYAPTGWVLIGDDGGGKGIFLDCSSSEGSVYRVDLGSMQRADAELVTSRFAAWVHIAFRLPEPPEDLYPERADVWLLRRPAGDSKGLVHLKSELNISTSIVQLYRSLEVLPCRLIRDVPFWKYAKICGRYNATDPCLGLFEVDRLDQPVRVPDPANLLVPPKMWHLIEQAHATMMADPQHRLPPFQRQSIYLSIGPSDDPVAQRRRGWLGLIAARFVLPLWHAGLPGNNLAARLLDAAESVLRGQRDVEAALSSASLAFDRLERMSIIRKGDGPSPKRLAGLLAGFAAVEALYEATGVHIFNKPWAEEKDTDESALDPWSTDAAKEASDAYAGGIWDDQSNPAKRKEFWEWWLFEAIPAAWQAASHERATENLH